MRFSVGTVHDFQMFKDKNFEISQGITILGDSGFQGITKVHEKSIIPYKKTKTKPLTVEQKAENKKQASKRVVIEHANRECKIFRICGNKYRGKHKNYETNWQLVATIVNLKKSTKNLNYATI